MGFRRIGRIGPLSTLINEMNLRAVRSVPAAVELLGLLGYSTAARPYDARGELGVDGQAVYLRNSSRVDQGYGVVVIETDDPLRGKVFARRLVEGFHDRPLALVGRRNGTTGWDEYSLIRPRLITGGGGTVAVARLTVDRERPTGHDVAVFREVHWEPQPDDVNQTRIDAAFDVERVTRRFFLGLAAHHRTIDAEIARLANSSPRIASGVELAGGSWRVSLRILTQVLFCYFLQRKGLIGGDRRWLSRKFREAKSAGRAETFYTEVMEPAFYIGLGRPEGDRPVEWRDVGLPYLDGGLFEAPYGDMSLPLAGDLFSTSEGLLGFLDGWTFTVAEEMADDAEVAVDPEMLGKVFENLIGDDDARQQGTKYTPRPVVQFMCREALVPHLIDRAALTEREARTLLTRDDGDEIAEILESAGVAVRIDEVARDITVIDPAVGSGAFPLGMLAEIVRLRSLSHRAEAGAEPDARTVRGWKLHAIEHSLFGVDVNPTAVELCRLRLWLSLIVDLPAGRAPDPLPNLEYRVVCADALPDFLAGVAFQSTRGGLQELDFDAADASELADLRRRYFSASKPSAKQALREEIRDLEDDLLGQIFRRAGRAAREQAASHTAKVREAGERAEVDVAALKERFQSSDRVYPMFLPGFHAPEVFRPGEEENGWDIAIMNPPYLSRKEANQHLEATRLSDYQRHYGRTFDLMIHFAFRALELVRRGGGVLTMIFNDSLFTSADADELRRALIDADYDGRRGAVRVAARTRCFEGVAVTGGVVVAIRDGTLDGFRWVENHGRPTRDLLAASSPNVSQAGESEMFAVAGTELTRLPHRPLFRPARPARRALDLFERCVLWEEFRRWEAPDREQADWGMLSETARLERWKERAARVGRLDDLTPSKDFVLLGLVTRGGQGLVTADDRRFLAALGGTREADEAEQMADRLEEALTGRHRATYERLRRDGRPRVEALLTLTLSHTERDLGWPKGGLIRVAPEHAVRHSRLTADEVAEGIATGPQFVPFEKGDSSDEGLGARWRRDNPIVIDWSMDSVALLRERASAAARHRKPRIQNERLWGQGGVTWNRVASFLRVREVPEGAIFSDKAPTIQPVAPWLGRGALMALLNSSAADFIIRTFLGSRMMVEIGDVRRLPVPVLTAQDAKEMEELGQVAMTAKADADRGGDPAPLAIYEQEIDARVRDLYGFRKTDDLWVVR